MNLLVRRDSAEGEYRLVAKQNDLFAARVKSGARSPGLKQPVIAVKNLES